MVLILGLFLFGIGIGLFCLAIVGAVLTLALRILMAIIRITIKILEHRKAEPEILMAIDDDALPVMRDVTPRLKAISATRPTQGAR